MTSDARRTTRSPSPPDGMVSALFLTDGRLIGWALDPADPDRRFVVEIVDDHGILAVLPADTHLPHLRDEGYGDGCHGFVLALDAAAREPQGRTLRLRLANTRTVLASAALEPSGTGGSAPPPTFALGGTVTWRGGLRLTGTLRRGRDDGGAPALDVFEGSRRLDCAVSFFAGEDESDTRSLRFDLTLPSSLADGRIRGVRVLDAGGTELQGSPVWLLAHGNGFRGVALSLDRRGDDLLRDRTFGFLDLLVPASLPLEAYPVWMRGTEEAPTSSDSSPGTVGVVILGRLAGEATLGSLEEQEGDVEIRAGIIDLDPHAPLCFEAWRWHALLERLGGGTSLDAVLVVRAGSRLKPLACRQLLDALRMGVRGPSGPAPSGPALCLADHELFDSRGRGRPLFLPAFDRERLLAQGYAEGLFAMTPDLAGTLCAPEDRNDARDLRSACDLLLEAVDHLGPRPQERVVHIPRILARVPQLPPAEAAAVLAKAVAAHLARSGEQAEVTTGAGPLLPALALRRPRPEGRVEIIVPTRDRLDLLRPCLETLWDLTDHPDYGITVVDNGSVDPATLAYLAARRAEGRITVIRDDGPFNYARLNNRAVAATEAPYLLFLNNDIEIVEPGWLDALHRVLARPGVGAAGAKLLWPNRMVQHGGVVLGTGFAASHAYDRCMADEPGYADGLLVARESGALTAACLMVRRDDFLGVGGFDERAFPVAFNDVDLCLKLRARGLALVWTPAAVLLHKESASRGSDAVSASRRARADAELAALRRRWGAALAEDPYYNPNLNLDAYAFTGLSFPPRDRGPRRNVPPGQRSIWEMEQASGTED